MGTGKEKWFQNWGPEKNFVSQNWDRKYLFCFKITIIFRSQFLDHNSFLVPTFQSKICFRSSLLRYIFLFRSPILRHTLSLESLERMKFIFIFKALREKNHDKWQSLSNILKYSFWCQGPFNN